MTERSGATIRLLVLAGEPFDLDGASLEGADPYEVWLTRDPDEIEQALELFPPDIVLIDTSFPDEGGITAMERVLATTPDMPVLALTPTPPPYDHVALAARAGASGFVDSKGTLAEVSEALDTVRSGGEWFPPDQTGRITSEVAQNSGTTTEERRSRLTGALIALVPLTGLIAAVQAGLWRRYMGGIGVRPVDLAVDPASRVLDTVVALLFVLGVVGPLFLIPTWLDWLRESSMNRGVVALILRRRKTAYVLAAIVWLIIAAVISLGPNVVFTVVIGPLVSVSILAKVLNANDELPRPLRIEHIGLGVAAAGAIIVFVAFSGVLAAEVLVIGPDLRTDGVHGFLAPRVLGVTAQPVHALNVNTGEEFDTLYLGGNADLYVLVDPCDADRVDLVSVGAHRLSVIDEVTCPSAGRQ